ncbi:VapE domain-containing protein [Agrobacterium sp. rho-8.1]|nr:VapE family protein [Agrobacterium sp. rho-8.1]
MSTENDKSLFNSNVVPLKSFGTTGSQGSALLDDLRARSQDGNFWYGEWLEANAITNGPSHKDVRGEFHKLFGIRREEIEMNIKFIADFGSLPRTVEDKLTVMLAKFSAAMFFDGSINAHIDERDVTSLTVLADKLHLTNADYRLGINSSDIDRAVNLWRSRNRIDLVTSTTKEIAYKPSQDDDAVWQYVADQHSQTLHSPAYVKAVYKKFVWQVKRKMLNLPITYHLMPVILGPQGTGKSWFVVKILNAYLSQFVHSSTFESIGEERLAEQWDYPIQWCDEMAYASLANADIVKNRITSDKVFYRPMGENYSLPVTNRSTFIGASNKNSIADIIRDETGNRRFAPVVYSNVPGDERIPFGYDPILFWTSVDEHGPDPMLEAADELTALQSSQRHLSTTDQFLLDYATKAEEAEEPTNLFSTLWAEFDDWKQTSNVKCKLTKNEFFRAIAGAADNFPDLYKVTNPQNKKTFTFLKVNANPKGAKAALKKAGVL